MALTSPDCWVRALPGGGDDGNLNPNPLHRYCFALVPSPDSAENMFSAMAPLPHQLNFQARGTLCLRLENGGDDGNRTHDPLLAGQVLSQLSYTPIHGLSSCQGPFLIPEN